MYVVVVIPHHSLLEEQVLKWVRPQARRLQSSLTGLKRRYLQKCETIFQEHNVYIKSRGIYILASYSTTTGLTEKINKLDKERDQYMKNAKKKCRKRRMGEVDFSPEVIVLKKRKDV